MTNQQLANEIINRLGVLIDEIQFTYCQNPSAKTVISTEAPQDPEKDDDGIPWDDDIPFA